MYIYTYSNDSISHIYSIYIYIHIYDNAYIVYVIYMLYIGKYILYMYAIVTVYMCMLAKPKNKQQKQYSCTYVIYIVYKLMIIVIVIYNICSN